MTSIDAATLDIVIPMLYVVAIMVAVFFASGKVVGAVSAIGAILVGMYWAGIRRNLKSWCGVHKRLPASPARVTSGQRPPVTR